MIKRYDAKPSLKESRPGRVKDFVFAGIYFYESS